MPLTTIRPVKPVTETVADISISGSYIHISFLETNEDFKQLIKDHGFSWSGFGVGWERKCTKFTGSPLDRATEISILLLKAGFIICISDDTLKDKILKKEFEPEQIRWITRLSGEKYDGWFCLSYEYRHNQIYKAATAIPGSKWIRPHVIIPPYQFEAVLDLREKFQFEMSVGALKAVADAGIAKEEALIVDMSETELPVKKVVKKEEAGIHASLRDDD